MKTYNLISLLLLIILPFTSKAQLIEGMEGGLSGGSTSDANFDSDIGDWFFLVDFLIDFGFAGGYGLFFGFQHELRPNEKAFNEFPYADGRSGLFLPEMQEGRFGRLQLLGHFQNNEDNLYGAYFQAKFYPDRFWIIDANHLELFETFDRQEGVDRLSMTNFNVQFNRVHHPKFNLFWGAGLMLVNGENNYGSPSLSGGFTWYFKKPLSLHAESQIGWPNGSYARQHQARMQVHLDRFMVYAGYQGTKVGGVGVANWAMGTGVWF